MPHSCCQIPLCGRDPFSLRASHHCLVSTADLLPNYPLPFSFIENCPFPSSSDCWDSPLSRASHLSSGYTKFSLKPFSLSSAPSMQSFQASHKTQLLHEKPLLYIVIPFLMVTSGCSMYFLFFLCPCLPLALY